MKTDVSSAEPLYVPFEVPRKETSPPGSPYGAPTKRKLFHLQSNDLK
jgi:hypothetical protein